MVKITLRSFKIYLLLQIKRSKLQLRKKQLLTILTTPLELIQLNQLNNSSKISQLSLLPKYSLSHSCSHKSNLIYLQHQWLSLHSKMILSHNHHQSSNLHRKMIFLCLSNSIRAPPRTIISLTSLSIKNPRPKLMFSQTTIRNQVKTTISLAAAQTITNNRNLSINSLTLKISVVVMFNPLRHTNSSSTMISLQCLRRVVTYLRCLVLQLRHQRINRTYLTCLAIE